MTGLEARAQPGPDHPRATRERGAVSLECGLTLGVEEARLDQYRARDGLGPVPQVGHGQHRAPGMADQDDRAAIMGVDLCVEVGEVVRDRQPFGRDALNRPAPRWS